MQETAANGGSPIPPPTPTPPRSIELSHTDSRRGEDANFLPQGFHALLPALLVIDIEDTAGVAPAPDRPWEQLRGQDLQLSATKATQHNAFFVFISTFGFLFPPPSPHSGQMQTLRPCTLPAFLLISQGKLRHGMGLCVGRLQPAETQDQNSG